MDYVSMLSTAFAVIAVIGTLIAIADDTLSIVERIRNLRK